jgi:phosphatidylinositol alpha-mannosyltransferase
VRIGICAPYDLAVAGGVNTLIRAQTNALAARGHDVCLFGAASGPLADGEISLGRCLSIVIGNTQTGFGVDPRSWWTAKRLLRERKFDVLHMHEPLMPLPSWFVLWQADVPVVATFHTYRSKGHVWYPKFRTFFEGLMRRVHVRLAISEAAKRTVAEHFPGDYQIMPASIDVERFTRPAPRPAPMSGDRRSVLYVGRIEPRKGVETLLRAMPAVQARVPRVQLVLVGGGPGRADVETLARELGVRVVFAGRVNESDLPAYYQAADVFCSPALSDESFGLTLLEAMAAGRPIVASDIAGYAELLTPIGSARLVPPGNVELLAGEISVLLTDTSLAQAMGARGASAAGRFDSEVIAKALERVYELCVNKLPVKG